MTILHISAVKSWGGGENHIENLTYELSVSNPEVKNIILCVHNSQFHKRLLDFSQPVETAPLSFNLDPRYIFKIISLCRKNHVDLIHLHDPRAMALAIAADRLYNLPPFIFSKKTSFPIKDRKQTLYKYNYHKIRRYLCVSETTKKVLAQRVDRHLDMVTIYHGTRVEDKDTATPYLLRQKLHIDSEAKIIGNIANHIKAKNLETFIEVAKYLVHDKGREDVHFVQIGTFTEKTPELVEKVKQLNLEHRVHFLGYLPGASNFIGQFDISLVTSISEGLPQFIYESFYHKIPVVSTAVGGIQEIIRSGENGFLSEKGDYRGLGEQILSLLTNPDLGIKFTEISQRALLEKYTTSIMAQQTLQQYKAVKEQNIPPQSRVI